MAARKPEIEALIKWLENNSAARLAVELDYKSTVTFSNWIRRGSIPRREVDKVMKIINGKAKSK